MTEEIRKVIEKDLPAQVGNTLKEVLEKGERDSLKVKELEEKQKTLIEKKLGFIFVKIAMLTT